MENLPREREDNAKVGYYYPGTQSEPICVFKLSLRINAESQFLLSKEDQKLTIGLERKRLRAICEFILSSELRNKF